jgi:hypothetical protein
MNQNGKRHIISLGVHANQNINSWQFREYTCAHDFPQSPLQSISLYSIVSILRNNETHPRMKQRGSDSSDLQMGSPNTLPLYTNVLHFIASGHAMAVRETELLTQLRISTATSQLGAVVPFCVYGSVPDGPTSFPFEHEIRACEYGAYSGVGKWVSPYDKLQSVNTSSEKATRYRKNGSVHEQRRGNVSSKCRHIKALAR